MVWRNLENYSSVILKWQSLYIWLWQSFSIGGVWMGYTCIQDLDDLSPRDSQVGLEVARVSSHKEPYHIMPHKCYDFHVGKYKKKEVEKCWAKELNLSLKAVEDVENDGAGGVRRIRKTRGRDKWVHLTMRILWLQSITGVLPCGLSEIPPPLSASFYLWSV